ncbi:MAG: SRPBCC domain-containing protein [Streptosporangiaceae bacterium]
MPDDPTDRSVPGDPADPADPADPGNASDVSNPGDPTAVRLERVIPATPGQVYRAWLDPDLLARWMAPGSMTVTKAEVDERAGGRFRIWQSDGGRDVGGFDGELTELVPAERLVFGWGMVGPDWRDGPSFDSRLTVTLRAADGGGTLLTLLHERLEDIAAAMPDVAAQIGPGWQACLDNLTDALSQDGAAADLGRPEAQRLLEHEPLARLAYTGPDGFPRVVPVGFLWRGGELIVCTAPTSPKVSALTARPHVALSLDTPGPHFTALLIRGIASIDVVDGVPDEYLAAATKGQPAEQSRQFEANVRSIYRQMARISIRPAWARHYDFVSGPVPEFMRKLAEGSRSRSGSSATSSRPSGSRARSERSLR